MIKIKRKTFSLIELIAVIAILSIVSVIAIPRYVNIQQEAAEATVNAVFGAAHSAAYLNYSQGVVTSDPANHVPITTGQELLDVMSESTKDDWQAVNDYITATINSTIYIIRINRTETMPSGSDPGAMAELILETN